MIQHRHRHCPALTPVDTGHLQAKHKKDDDAAVPDDDPIMTGVNSVVRPACPMRTAVHSDAVALTLTLTLTLVPCAAITVMLNDEPVCCNDGAT